LVALLVPGLSLILSGAAAKINDSAINRRMITLEGQPTEVR
jgi:hypothetical protein